MKSGLSGVRHCVSVVGKSDFINKMKVLLTILLAGGCAAMNQPESRNTDAADIIDPFDANNLLQTLILVLGFLSLANIVVNLWFGSVSRQALTSESQSVLAQPLPQGRMLDTMTQVFNAINTIEQKYFEHVN